MFENDIFLCLFVIKLIISSLNTYGYPAYNRRLALKDRYFAIANYFNDSKIDVIHLQEIFTYYHLLLFKKMLKSFPYHYFEKSLIGPKGGLVTFSRIPLVKIQYYRFLNLYTPLNRSLLEAILGQKGMLITKIQDKDIALVNVHFKAVLNYDWNISGKYYKMVFSQVKKFKEILKNKEFKIVIASGDFNLDRKSSIYEELLDLKGLKDINGKSKKNTFYNKFDRNTSLSYCLDYILIYGNSKKYKILDKRYVLEDMVKLRDSWGFVSDHIGLSATLVINL